MTWATVGEQDGARGRGGEGNSGGKGKGGGVSPQPEVWAVQSIPPGIQQMPAHHAHQHHQPIYNIDPNMGDLIPPRTHQTPRQPPPCLRGDAPHDPAPAAREPRAEPARIAAAPAARGSGAEPARLRQEPRAEPARGAVGAPHTAVARGDPVPDGDAIPIPPGGAMPPPLVIEVYGWLNWATSGTTRGLRNGFFNAALLWRDGGNRKVPPRG